MKMPSAAPNRVLCRVISSRLKAVESACGNIRALLQANGLGAVAFPVELAARECLNNAALHGNRGNAAKRIGLDVRIGRNWIRVQVTDEGKGFDWRRARAAALPGSRAIHGRGLPICARYAERVVYNRRGNRVTLWLGKTKKEN